MTSPSANPTVVEVTDTPTVTIEPATNTLVVTLEVERSEFQLVLEPSNPPLVVEVTSTGPQGAKGDEGDSFIYVGPTPPDDTSMVWVKTVGEGVDHPSNSGSSSYQDPVDLGYSTWSVDPRSLSATITPTVQQVYVIRLRNTTGLSNATVAVDVAVVAASTTTAPVAVAALYRADDRTQVGSTQNLGAQLQDVGARTVTFTGITVPADVDLLYAFVISTAGSPVTTLLRGSSNTSANGKRTGNAAHFASAGTGQTTLPSTLPALTAIGNAQFAGAVFS